MFCNVLKRLGFGGVGSETGLEVCGTFAKSSQTASNLPSTTFYVKTWPIRVGAGTLNTGWLAIFCSAIKSSELI